MYFQNRKHRHFRHLPWHAFFAFLFILGSVLYLISIFAGAGKNPPTETGLLILNFSKVILGLSGGLAVFAGLLLFFGNLEYLKTNTEKLDNTVEMLSRQNNLLTQVSQASQLSDTAKEIVYRDSEQMELAEAALTKLHQHEFDEADAMVSAMSKQSKYAELSTRLKKMAEKYRSATEEGRVSQIVSHIESLFDQRLWIQAAAQTENLIKMFPYSEKAKTMPKLLRERKALQKSELLAEWDLAVREKDTDRGLEILKELDLYLTPTEALALRESAATVFKTKLHNLGVEFSVAITEQNWIKALQTGRDIVQNFPNSRMASEIRGKMDILQERAKMMVS